MTQCIPLWTNAPRRRELSENPSAGRAQNRIMDVFFAFRGTLSRSIVITYDELKTSATEGVTDPLPVFTTNSTTGSLQKRKKPLKRNSSRVGR